jgi:hypothetical protein
MYLHTGWEKFAHNLQVGFLGNFLYEGDSEMSVKVFIDESCRSTTTATTHATTATMAAKKAMACRSSTLGLYVFR